MKKKVLLISIVIILFMIVYWIFIPKKVDSANYHVVERLRESDSMLMVFVPEGEFTMGSSLFESYVFTGNKLFPFSDQRPRHLVYLDAYWIDKTEVSVGQFRKFVMATGYVSTAEKQGWGKPWQDGPKEEEWDAIDGIDWLHPHHPERESSNEHPVVQVSWDDACAYCEWVGGALPTEAQWEKAARGTDRRKYPWGNTFDGTKLNYGDSSCPVERWRDTRYNDGYAYTSPVGSYLQGASPYGALDMAGNVWEWVNDWYAEDYYEVSPYKNPPGPENGNVKAMRGGSWYDGEAIAWVTNVIRHQNPTNDMYQDVGFRCVFKVKNTNR